MLTCVCASIYTCLFVRCIHTPCIGKFLEVIFDLFYTPIWLWFVDADFFQMKTFLLQVKLGQGIDMLKIFKDYDAETSILDDFNFYDEREKAVQEKKVRQRVHLLTKNDSVEDASIKQLSDNLSGALQLEDGKDVPKTG